MSIHTINVYDTEEQALAGLEELKNKGYKTDDISIVAKNAKKLEEAADDVTTTTGDGLVAGAATGGAIGLTGLLVGMSSFAIPGIGPLLAAGPIIATLGGAAAGSVVGGGLSGAFKNAGLSSEEASRYEEDVNNGKILIIVDRV